MGFIVKFKLKKWKAYLEQISMHFGANEKSVWSKKSAFAPNDTKWL